MKITWFGGRTLRIYIGGEIVVWHPMAKSGISAEELVSGASIVVEPDRRLLNLPDKWRPRRTATALEEAGQPAGIEIMRVGATGSLIDAPGEPPLLIAADSVPPLGRWARDAVVVAFSATEAAQALDALGPRLIALAMGEAALDTAFAAFRDRLGETALVALEPGMAVEV